jgi:SAM-dependent methyltransferase
VARLLAPQPGEKILDVGAGQGVLAPIVAQAGARYTGVDASPRLIQLAQKRHGRDGRFIVADARKLAGIAELRALSFDAVVFLLSLQDMDPLDLVLAQAAALLRTGGRLVLLLTHPAFRVPRQSGWGWDEGRRLMYRRVDRYLTPLPVPMKPLPGSNADAKTRSFHRPLEAYINGLAAQGLLTERIEEIPAHKLAAFSGTHRPARPAVAQTPRAANLARKEIPLFLGLVARKVSPAE